MIDLIDDFSVLDGEVGKRLNDMVPVPVSTSLYAMIHLLISAFSLGCSFSCHSMFLRQMERFLLLMKPSQIIKDSLTGKPQFCSFFFSLFANNNVCGLTVYLINDLSVTNDLFYISTLILCSLTQMYFFPFS